MKISSNFDSGNIEVADATDPTDIKLRIRKDTESDFFQWFHFQATGPAAAERAFTIVNAGEAAYSKGWEGYQACASYDREDWFRIPTTYDGKQLRFAHVSTHEAVYYAYFAPYSRERHRDLIARSQMSPRARLEVLGETLDGDDLDLLVIGDDAEQDRKACWLIARQHPGESMAEWWMEGFLERALDPDDTVACAVLDRAVLYLVPNMNPDGSRRGNLRTNAAGANLNRVWAEPSMEKSPEVFLVRQRMVATGLDFSLDVHGDEAQPYNFVIGSAHVPSADDRMKSLLPAFKQAYQQANPDFQTKHGYSAPAKANLAICSSNLAEHFKALAMTLEMPFKDNADAPDARNGWSPERCRQLGRAALTALYAVVDDLR
jgi:murein tripeptide amidase MpaA